MCPPSLARAKATSRRRPKLRRCLIYLKDRSFLPQPFLSPAESLWQATFQLWNGNSRLGSGLCVCQAGMEDSCPFPEECPGGPRSGPGGAAHRTQLAPSGRELLCWQRHRLAHPLWPDHPPPPGTAPPDPQDQEGGPWSPGIASDTPEGPTGTADPLADRPLSHLVSPFC